MPITNSHSCVCWVLLGNSVYSMPQGSHQGVVERRSAVLETPVFFDVVCKYALMSDHGTTLQCPSGDFSVLYIRVNDV